MVNASSRTGRKEWTTGEICFLRDHYGPLSPSPQSTAWIAAQLDRTPRAIRKQVVKHGVAWRPHRHVNPERFRRLWEQGLNDCDIARRCDVCSHTVNRWRIRAGLVKRNCRLPIFAESIKQMREQGWGCKRIARHLGLERNRCREYIRKLERS